MEQTIRVYAHPQEEKMKKVLSLILSALMLVLAVACATTATPAVTATVSITGSPPDLTSAFQPACSAADSRTTSMTSTGTAGPLLAPPPGSGG